jgi:hypothetical protein
MERITIKRFIIYMIATTGQHYGIRRPDAEEAVSSRGTTVVLHLSVKQSASLIGLLIFWYRST